MAQQVRHVPSPQGVSQHEQEGPGSSGVKTSGAAGAPGMSDTHTHCQASQSAVLRAGLPTRGLAIHTRRRVPAHRQPTPASRLHHPCLERSCRHLVHAQVSKANGCRAIEQQKQQKQQKQKQSEQTGGGKTRVSSLSCTMTEMSITSDEEGENAPDLRQIVQARLPPIPACAPPMCSTPLVGAHGWGTSRRSSTPTSPTSLLSFTGASGAQEVRDHHDRCLTALARYLFARGLQQPLWGAD